jgi:hypothetical protein
VARLRADAILIMVTPEERAKVREMAAQNSLSMSSYLRSRLMRAVQREAQFEQRFEQQLEQRPESMEA